MRPASAYQRLDRNDLYQLGPTAIRVGFFLAGVCLSFGAAVATLIPVSLEQRLGNLFFLGLVPAVGCYAAGHILGQLLVLASKICDMIVARCSRCAVLFLNDLLGWVCMAVSNVLARLPGVRREVCCSTHQAYWRVHWAIFDLSCLLIRSVAQFIIRMQGC
jgi:hypothetical protein